MATDNAKRKSTVQGFDVEFTPCPPGTMARQRLPRGGEPGPLPFRAWWLIGAAALVALFVGILLGRLL
jgi:hypothetical protein